MLIIAVVGGLGNQMFQYAFYRNLEQRERKVKIDIRSSWKDGEDSHDKYELNRIFLLRTDIATMEDRKIYHVNNNLISRLKRKIFHTKTQYYSFRLEETISFSEKFFHMEDMYIYANYQSEKYFENITEVIRRDYAFDPITVKNTLFFEQIKNTNSVSIHIRRGDYLRNADLKDVCTLSYYKNAIQEICRRITHPTFFIFSNDIPWCKENFPLEKAIFVTGNTGRNSYRDMQLMSYCKHNIIANSTFSWWGAWLNANPNKIVIAPDKWFNGVDGTKDIIPERWIKVQTR